MFHKGSIQGSKLHLWVYEAQHHGTLKPEAFKLLSEFLVGHTVLE